MKNQDFKNLLKESILSKGSNIFLEAEEAGEAATEAGEASVEAGEAGEATEEADTSAESEDNSEETIESKLIKSLKIAAADSATIKQSGKLIPEEFARISAYYFLGMYYDENENWDLSLRSNSIFNRNLNIVLETLAEKNKNVFCTFSEVLDWVLAFGAYTNPEIFVASLRTQSDETILNKINNVLAAINNKGFSISGGNTKIINQLIAKVGKGFNTKECPPSGADQSTSEESASEENTSEEFKKLNLKVGDLIIVKNRKGQEVITTIAEIPEELMENQGKDPTAKFIIGGSWSIPFNGKKGFNSKGQRWIAIKNKKIVIRKPKIEDLQKALNIDPITAAKLNIEDDLEDADTEEISREENPFKTPEDTQAFKTFKKGLLKVPVIDKFADKIITALKEDIPENKQSSLQPNSLEELISINEEEEEEAKYIIRDSQNIQAIINIIADKQLIAAKWTYVFIKRFLSRNGMDLNRNAEIKLKSLKVVPDKEEDMIAILKTAKAAERNLEEQRYDMLLKRFDIK